MPPSARSPWVWLPPATGLALLVLLLATDANRAVFLALNHAGHALGPLGPLGPLIWLHLTMLGDGAVGLALVLPCIRRAPHCFWAALAAAIFAAVWTQLPKQFIDVARPLAALAPEQFYQFGPAYRRVSFPSGHAAAAFAMAGIWIMGVATGALVRALLLLLATLVSLSRIMVGVHWPLDIVWGMLGGWLGAWMGLALQRRRGWRTGGKAGLAAGLVLLGVAASLLVSRHIGIPAVMTLQRVVGAVCLVWGAREIALMLPWLQRRRMRGRPAGARQKIKERTDG
jgi:membrane-associated phospholipid phosphatase